LSESEIRAKLINMKSSKTRSKLNDLKKAEEKLMSLKSLLEYRLERTDSSLKEVRKVSREIKKLKNNK